MLACLPICLMPGAYEREVNPAQSAGEDQTQGGLVSPRPLRFHPRAFLQYHPHAAIRLNSPVSFFFIANITSITVPGLLSIISSRATGTTCQDSPGLSSNQPH